MICENCKDSTDPQILGGKRLRVEETEILDLKNIITELKEIQEGFNSNSNKQKKDSVNLIQLIWNYWIWREEWNYEKWADSKGLMGNHQTDQYTHYRSQIDQYTHYRSRKRRRERKRCRELIERNNCSKLPKFDKRHRYTNTRNSMNPK